MKMTINEEIITIANKLADQGKSPSVALIKSRLSRAAPLPAIIAALKSWQHVPEEKVETVSVAPLKNNAASSETINEQLMDSQAVAEAITTALTPIQRELSDIKALLQTLLKHAEK